MPESDAFIRQFGQNAYDELWEEIYKNHGKNGDKWKLLSRESSDQQGNEHSGEILYYPFGKGKDKEVVCIQYRNGNYNGSELMAFDGVLGCEDGVPFMDFFVGRDNSI